MNSLNKLLAVFRTAAAQRDIAEMTAVPQSLRRNILSLTQETQHPECNCAHNWTTLRCGLRSSQAASERSVSVWFRDGGVTKPDTQD
ncbi:hypothetical protein SRHO_G00015780 [Serrasalmus rhombeus]